MAKDASFDLVSLVDLQEVRNAINQTQKEIDNRYDFKGIDTEIALISDKINIVTDDELHMKSIVDVLQTKLIRREVPIENLKFNITESTGKRVKQSIDVKQGIEKELAKKISKDIKNLKLKVQTQTMEEKIRVSGKKIDDLQAVIGYLKEKDYGIALQFDNFRS